jgi:uncharacterized cupredoxin-like copper-binding protein
MPRLLAIVFLLSGWLPTLASAHDTDFAFGSPGRAAEVTRTIHVVADDTMRLHFDATDLREGDVVRFEVRNTGRLAHEFGIADAAGQREHAQMMRQMPDMAHDDPNVITLKPGQTRSLIWKFTHMRQHRLVFACNVPGHYEAGMFLRLTVKK